MHFNYYNVILITTICLTYSIACARANKDCNDLLVPSRNGRNCRQESLQGSTENISGIGDFLSRQSDLFTLTSSFDNNEEAIDILKSVIRPNEGSASSTKLDKQKEIDFENLGRNFPYAKTEAKDRKPIEKGTTTQVYDISQIDNKSTSGFLPVENNSNRANTEKSITAKDTNPGLLKNSRQFSIKTDTKTEDRTDSSEIILSEITNLSLDDIEEGSLGQKVKFQLSSKELEEGKENAAGKEILQNATVICGYLLGKRISFAEPTTLMEFPWTALLLYNTNIRYHCGGSLITTKYVLTAAHCVAQEYYELIGVRLGEYDISEPIDCAPDIGGSNICATTIDADVVKIIVHHDFSHRSFKNDIALIRLDKDYLGRSFYPICLPTPDMTYDHKTATVAGWGATEKAIRSSILLKATVPIFDISKCREIYRRNVFNETTEICASGMNEVDVCKGDSGGAIFYGQDVRGRERFFQLGIISLGVRGCGDKRFLPAVFTKLNAFYKWIENNLEY